VPEAVRRYYERPRPIELRPVEFERYIGRKMNSGNFHVWIRTTGKLPDEPAIHQCVLAYASDMMLLDSALIPHGRTVFEPTIMAASLDHALWFHRPFRADDWLLYAHDSPNLAGSRGFSRGLIFARDGTLVASVAQEGLLREREAGLVVDRAEGTRRVYHIDPKGLAAIRTWLDQFWGVALQAYAEEVESSAEELMHRTISPAPVRNSIRVAAPPKRAFEVFTAGMGRWWPKTHSIGASDLDALIIEPREGGRWFERGVDGAECEVGKVLVWEPPSRLVLCWQLTPDFTFDPDLITEVEVLFIADGENATRVELEHRNLERFGDRADDMRQKIDSPGGWPGLLQLFAQWVNEAERSAS
jgi:uncharacterized protein YndB with AHSA1/START domain